MPALANLVTVVDMGVGQMIRHSCIGVLLRKGSLIGCEWFEGWRGDRRLAGHEGLLLLLLSVVVVSSCKARAWIWHVSSLFVVCCLLLLEGQGRARIRDA